MVFDRSSSAIAFKDTLELLEWSRLCEHLSTFASTEIGKRICKKLNLPENLDNSRLRLKETLEMGFLDQTIDGGISFQGVHDLENILIRCCKGGVVSGEELLFVADTLAAGRRLRRQIDDGITRPILTSLLENLSTLPTLEKLLKFGLEDGGRVADRASLKLANLRSECKKLRLKRLEMLQKIQIKYSSILQDTVISERNGRPVLSLKVGTSDQLYGIVHDSSASGSTVFVEPRLAIPLGNQISKFEVKICQEEQSLLKQWSGEVGDNFSSLDHLMKVILHFDLALARARYGQWMGGVPPSFQDETDTALHIQGFRHPLLVWQEHFDRGNAVIPINIEINSGLRVIAITGPNTGGKTVTLKSVGLAVLMARAGLLLPCVGNPSLPWFDQVLADIGDEQSLQQSLSTFSGHVMRIRRILDAINQSNGESLVLLDEVGAGTDPSEGSALAISLLKTLADRARLTIATTHFGELKALKYTDRRFENASVAFDSETITPTYDLQWGIPGRSNALAIAKRLCLDPVVIERAQELIAKNLGEDVNQVISGLEEQRARQQIAAEEAAVLLAKTELLHDELLCRWEKYNKKSNELEKVGRQKLEASIRQGQKEVRDLICRLRAEGADGELARLAGKRLRLMEKENVKGITSKNKPGWIPKVGERIRLLALNKAAEILDISEDGMSLTVLCGVFRSTVDLNSVESLDGRRPDDSETVIKIKTFTSIAKSSDIRTKRNTVDVRGLRVSEAEVVLEDYLRKSTGPIWVVHGIGSGRLKLGLREWLNSLSYVQRVVDADQHDGGAGCSVVWLC